MIPSLVLKISLKGISGIKVNIKVAGIPINKEKNILYVIHDEDVFWQFLCGDNHSDEEARIVSLEEIYIIDKSIERLVNLDYGPSAYRKDETSDWIKG